MSILSKNLKELIEETNLDYKTVAEQIGISASRLTDYILHDKLPSVRNLIKIADYFDCSTDYLLLNKNYNEKTFCTPAPFDQRLAYLKDFYKLNHKDIYSKDGITKSRYFEWLSGKCQPSVDNLINLAYQTMHDCATIGFDSHIEYICPKSDIEMSDAKSPRLEPS